MSDDYSSSTSTTGRISAGDSSTGNIEISGDTDWFQVSLTGGTSYQIDLQGSPTNSGTLSDTYLRGIYNSNGTQLSGTTDDDDGSGRDSSLDFTPDSTGTYYISAGAYSSNTGTYQLSIDNGTGSGDGDDYSSSTSTTGRISAGDSSTGNIEISGDTDWFQVSLTGGTSYQIDLQGSPTNSGTLSDTYLRGIYNSNGTQLSGTTDDDDGSGRDSSLDFTPDSTGTYYISAGAYSSNTGTYQLSIDNGTGSGDGDDYSSSTSTTGRISAGDSSTGNIEISGDTDWFQVSLTGGTSYQIDLQGSPTNSGTLSDTYLRGIYNSNGTQLSGTTDDDDGSGRDSSLDFTPDSTGTYYISAGAYSSNTGTYQLSIDNGTGSGDGDDYSSSTSTTGRISAGDSSTGNIEISGDTDWFQVSLTGGTSYQIDLQGSPTNSGTLSDTYLRGIYNSNGTQLSGTTDDDDGSGRDSSLDFTPDSTGTYYISAGAYSSNTGTYQLSIDNGTGSGDGDDYSSSTSTTGRISVGDSSTGNIEISGDTDWFQVSLTGGTSYQIDLQGSPTNSGTLSDTYLRGIYNSNGTQLSGTTDDDDGSGHDSSLDFTPDSTGTYYISAGAYSSNTGTYQLSIDDNNDSIQNQISNIWDEATSSESIINTGLSFAFPGVPLTYFTPIIMDAAESVADSLPSIDSATLSLGVGADIGVGISVGAGISIDLIEVLAPLSITRNFQDDNWVLSRSVSASAGLGEFVEIEGSYEEYIILDSLFDGTEDVTVGISFNGGVSAGYGGSLWALNMFGVHASFQGALEGGFSIETTISADDFVEQVDQDTLGMAILDLWVPGFADSLEAVLPDIMRSDTHLGLLANSEYVDLIADASIGINGYIAGSIAPNAGAGLTVSAGVYAMVSASADIAQIELVGTFENPLNDWIPSFA